MTSLGATFGFADSEPAPVLPRVELIEPFVNFVIFVSFVVPVDRGAA